MLELGAVLVDSFVLQLVSDRIINYSNFTSPDEEGEIHLYPLPLRKFIKAWEAKLDSPIKHLRTGEVTYRHCIELQVKEYLACIMGIREFYRPMLCHANFLDC
ncbi:MAG: hypothetical protein WA865_11650 [Spirulinaceae cyanobacterium]